MMENSRWISGCRRSSEFSRKPNRGVNSSTPSSRKLAYRVVTGINNFPQLIRFDADSTLTDTNEISYGITQRLWVKEGEDQPQELISWSLTQKHFFDPTFGGALVPGVRNVFQTLDEISPFAFADGPRNWSPLISDFKVTPGGPLDFEQILEYDTQRGSARATDDHRDAGEDQTLQGIFLYGCGLSPGC